MNTKARLFLYLVVAPILGLLLAIAVVAGEKLYQTRSLSPGDVAVSCVNGTKPVVQEVATDKRVIIVSCPFERSVN